MASSLEKSDSSLRGEIPNSDVQSPPTLIFGTVENNAPDDEPAKLQTKSDKVELVYVSTNIFIAFAQVYITYRAYWKKDGEFFMIAAIVVNSVVLLIWGIYGLWRRTKGRQS